MATEGNYSFSPEARSALSCIDEHAAWEEASKTPAELRLQGGESWRGWSFGAKTAVAGEVVFTTAMVGYPESLTDPSFAGQILVLTYPLIGNYGVPVEEPDELGLPKHFEGGRIFPVAVVVAEYSFCGSHYLARRTLAQWLEANNVPGIFGVDTRSITKHLRTSGSTLGVVVVGEGAAAPAWEDPNKRNLVAEVSIKQPRVFELAGDAPEKPKPRIVAVDCGMKYNIIRFLAIHMRARVKVVPWDYDFLEEEFDGLFISNGPGDPGHAAKTIENLRRVMQARPSTPIFGICLGHQLLALAAGAKSYKMKFGNRGMNQPCVDLRTGRCYITAQNHGFAVDAESLPAGWKPLYTNANDGSNEGIGHEDRPWFSVQFHPEACGGPVDTSFLFDEFFWNMTSSSGRRLTTIAYHHPRPVAKVLVLGSGGLTIGQAGEFDYSGSQAIKALREGQVSSVLINPNIATVQTSKGLADRVYFLPVTPEFVTKVIEKERPDGLFAAFGGQTALNCAIALHEDGTLEKYNVRVLGTQIDAIKATEDRGIFKERVESLGLQLAKAACADTVDEAKLAAKDIGYPVLVRAAFALGGLGSGFAANEEELVQLCNRAFINSPQVIIDECLKGWKELEYEVMRDSRDNCLVVCNMENIDPMGIHTGDSVVVAPSQTLTNDEFHRLREIAIRVIRHFGIVGEANIQYALDPNSDQVRIVEVNPRLSRSSALASKATGYPLAYIAAKIALGHDLISLRNLVTRSTTACFEPALDYCVVKIPRWDIDKFPTVKKELGTQMKSVGEVMSIGRSLTEAIQKAMRMVYEGSMGFDEDWYLKTRQKPSGMSDAEALDYELQNPGPYRLWALAHAFAQGRTIEQVHQLTRIDNWFLSKFYTVHAMKQKLSNIGGLPGLTRAGTVFLKRCKQVGFCDRQIAAALGDCGPMDVMKLRRKCGVHPSIKQVDTLAAEFPAQTNYLYLSYVGDEHDVEPLRSGVLPAYKDSLMESVFGKGTLEEEDASVVAPKLVAQEPSLPTDGDRLSTPAVRMKRQASGDEGFNVDSHPSYIVLGSGCYRIGASVEFDWGAVSAVRTLRQTGHRAMVINCNPETVSTDYDESDRLYFEELSLETVIEICRFELPTGVVVSVGGQTPNNLAVPLSQQGVRIMGTSPSSIDRAEDRSKFSALCDELDINQPEWSQFVKIEDALGFARKVSYPVLVRPSYVLSGAAMRVIEDDEGLKKFLTGQAVTSQEFPVVISKYIKGAREIEFDAIASKGRLVNYAISEHVENAGTHSGDATLLLPAQQITMATQRSVLHIASQLCEELMISGPFNVQFMSTENVSSSARSIQVIECNLRASRTVPFVSKTLNANFIELAIRVMLGQTVKPKNIVLADFNFIACKAAMFSFLRLSGSDPRVGVEMQSTGEVACFGRDAHEAFLKSVMASGLKLPRGPCGVLLSIGPQEDKETFMPYVRLLSQMGHTLYATTGTAAAIKDRCPNVSVQMLHNATTPKPPNVDTAIKEGLVKLVITAPSSRDSEGATAGYFLRRKALDAGIALVVDLRLAMMLVDSLFHKFQVESAGGEFWTLESWHECHRVGT
jgi:carbamoyl-phosphate synthase small subunit